MKIKFKIIIPMLTLTVFSVAAILLSNILQYSIYVDKTLEEKINTASSAALSEIDKYRDKTYTSALYIASDPIIITAVKENDAKILADRVSELFKETKMDFCTVADSTGIVLTRPHKPESYGDNVSAIPSVRSALSGIKLTDIEKGASVRLSVCSGIPIYDKENTLIGVVSVGLRLDTCLYVDSVKSLFGCEATVFLNDERISTTLLKDDGTRATGTKAAENVSETVLGGSTYSGTAKIFNRDAFTKYTPLKGSDGKVLGMMFVGVFLDEKINTVWQFIINGLLITLALLAVSVPVILTIVRRIVTPVKETVKSAYALAEGNTDIIVRVNSKDEMAELAESFNNMITDTKEQIKMIEAIAGGDLTVKVKARSANDSMNNAIARMVKTNNETIAQIINSANEVSSGAVQISEGASFLAQGSVQQAAAVEELSSSLSEIAFKSKENAEMAGKAVELSERIGINAENGNRCMEEMISAVKDINQASQSIGNVIKVIDDITFQTKILSLNAAVEAEQAGKYGKGFAVVADEVRNLAEKSAEAAKNTAHLIENTIKKAELGVHIANETAVSLSEILLNIKENNEVINKISKSSDEQSTGISQINKGIEQVAQVVHKNSATAEESAAASELMSSQAEILNELTTHFKI